MILSHSACYFCRQSSALIICDICAQDADFSWSESGAARGNIHLNKLPIVSSDLLTLKHIYEHLLTPQYHHLNAIGPYAWPLDHLVQRLKFGHKLPCAEVLARLFYQQVYPGLAATNALPELLIPVPLSARRYAKRGFNQAQAISEQITLLSGIPCYAMLKRTRHTQAQMRLSKAQRLSNLHAAFYCKPLHGIDHVALVDDVITTGSTANTISEAILSANPHLEISVWSMALTLRN